MTAPTWAAAAFTALAMLIAVSCAGRLVLWRPRGRDTELDADGLHVLMGVAMAGMLEPRLSPFPGLIWQVVFTATAAWFAWQAMRVRRSTRIGPWQCAHPAPHAIESAAMVYMLLPAGPGHGGQGTGMAMPGMDGAAGTAPGNPALALVLALYVLGYMLWTTDRLASLSRDRVASAEGRLPAATPKPVEASASGTPGSAGAALARTVGRPPLAPRFAACYKIAMSVAMGYMLVMLI